MYTGYREIASLIDKHDLNAFKQCNLQKDRLDEIMYHIIENVGNEIEEWLNHWVANGGRVYRRALHFAAYDNNLCAVRYMLSVGITPGTFTIVSSVSRKIVRLLIDCGLRQNRKDIHKYKADPYSVNRFQAHETAIRNRIQRRQSALITLCSAAAFGASRCCSRYRDVLQIIARCVWSARLTEDFWFE